MGSPCKVAKLVGSSAYYLHGDGVGSTRVVTDSSLTVRFSASYHPYGVAYSVTGSELFRYTDKLRESVTGLYYSMARWYDPQVGRFVSEDSYNGTRNDPLSQNRYVYSEDNPMRYVDPNGHYIRPLYTDWGNTLNFLPIPPTVTDSNGIYTITYTQGSDEADCPNGYCNGAGYFFTYTTTFNPLTGTGSTTFRTPDFTLTTSSPAAVTTTSTVVSTTVGPGLSPHVETGCDFCNADYPLWPPEGGGGTLGPKSD